jgi:FixJ family two-component response regulator
MHHRWPITACRDRKNGHRSQAGTQVATLLKLPNNAIEPSQLRENPPPPTSSRSSTDERRTSELLSSPREPSSTPNPTVFVIDDDAELRNSLGRLLRSVHMDAQLFASVPEFLKCNRPNSPACLVLEIRLPGQSGLELQRELSAANIPLPIIFVTGHGDIPMSVQAMKRGAIEFLTKPFREQELLDAIQLGLDRDRARQECDKALSALRERFEKLSPREREVMIQVAQGRLSKQIAADLGISEITVKVHRSNMRRKMKVRSLSELIRIADKLGLVQETI